MIPPATRIAPFYAIGIGQTAYAMQARGESVVHMEFGQPSTGAPKAAIARAHQVLDADGLGYWESPDLKARISRHYATRYGVDIATGRIPLISGASGALVLTFTAMFKPGDTIAIARPGYPAYRNTLNALHLNVLELDCGPATGYKLTAAQVAALDPAPAGLLVASPANPTGTMLTRDELAELVDVCARRNILLISDEIYHGLTYGAPAHSALEITNDVIVVNSFSKYFSMAGWRLGWLVVPEALAETFATFNGNLFLTPPSLAQHAALVAMDQTAELEGHIENYRRNRALMLERLPRMGISRIAPPDGAFYIYADIGHLTNDTLAFCEKLVRETGVAVAPGIDFDPLEGNRFVRFSFAVSTPEVDDALGRLERWLKA